MNFAEALQIARAVNREAVYYRSLSGLFQYDQWTSLPRRGGAYRQEMSAFFGAQKAKLYASDDARSAAAYLDGAPLATKASKRPTSAASSPACATGSSP